MGTPPPQKKKKEEEEEEELCSYKPFGLLCSLLYSVLKELRCQINKPCLNQEEKSLSV